MHWFLFPLLIGCLLPSDVCADTSSIRTGGVAERVIGGGSVKDTEWIDLMTVTEIAMAVPSLSKLREIYDVTELGFKLEQSRHITVFMPNNDAIDSEKLNEIILYMNYSVIVRLLSAHIIPEVIEVSDLSDGEHIFITAPGDQLIMKIEHEVNDEALWGGIIETVDEKNVKRQKTIRIQLKLDNSTVNVIGERIDNANGVSYIVDGLLVPDDVRSTMKEAYNLWKFEKEGKRKSPESIAPDYIKETNLHHWFYGRAGGDTPEYREHTVEDEGQKKTKTGDERKRSNGIVGKNTKTNGHRFEKVGVIASVEDDPELSPIASIEDPELSPIASIEDPELSPIASIEDPELSQIARIEDPELLY